MQCKALPFVCERMEREFMTALYDNLKFPSGPRFKSPIGKRTDLLFVLAFAGNRKGHSYWMCVCDCGEMCVRSQKELNRKTTNSCGCARVNRIGTKGVKRKAKEKPAGKYDTVKTPTNANFKSLLGKRFGRLFVLAFDGRKTERNFWKCICDCGNMRVVSSTRLGSQDVRSCGCGGEKRKRRGVEIEPEHEAWSNMRRRCGDPTNKSYRIYGEKGITVCDRWAEYKNFIEDMGRKPTPKHSIDRIDGNRNYEPGNCRWATATEQARNVSTNVLLDYKGERKCITEWAEAIGMKGATLGVRIRSGWSVEDAIETPVGEKRISKRNEV